jgi:hypothetical protein
MLSEEVLPAGRAQGSSTGVRKEAQPGPVHSRFRYEKALFKDALIVSSTRGATVRDLWLHKQMVAAKPRRVYSPMQGTQAISRSTASSLRLETAPSGCQTLNAVAAPFDARQAEGAR